MTEGTGISRARLVHGGAALVLSGSLASALAVPASAGTAPDGDLAALRLLIGAELLALDFQRQALATGKLGSEAAATVKRMRADERAHYAALANLLSQAGQTPATADDIDFAYPKPTFRTESSILARGEELEALQLGAYIGASANLQTPRLRIAIAQISANEAQHTAALAALSGRPLIGKPFGPALQPDAVSAALDAYES
ncbi:MAG TPA: ferritin-like domain-containing protein [Gaiellaceae bacterium]|nr:ferritin-like domain-containing protein [Gaiellaceae bacterium]